MADREEWRWRDGKTKVVHRLEAKFYGDRYGWTPLCGVPRASNKLSHCAQRVTCVECIARSE